MQIFLSVISSPDYFKPKGSFKLWPNTVVLSQFKKPPARSLDKNLLVSQEVPPVFCVQTLCLENFFNLKSFCDS